MTTVTVKADKAINLDDISAGGEAPKVVLEPGTYAVTMESDMKYAAGNTPVDQVILFNIYQSVHGHPDKVFQTVSTTTGLTFTVHLAGEPVYLAILDQGYVTDNSGEATVTFTKLS